MEQYNMLPNILRHSIQVKNVAVAIVSNLADPTIVDKELVIAGALLHDIAKTRTIERNEMRHDLIGGTMLREMGYDTIAPIVESHVIMKNCDLEGTLNESEIVYYADKRVMHDVIVSIDTRVEDLINRYGVTEKVRELISENKKFVLALEIKIRKALTRDIESVIEELADPHSQRGPGF